MSAGSGRAKKGASAVRRGKERQAVGTVTADAVSGTVSGEEFGEAVQRVATEIVDQPPERRRPPGAVDDFLERWVAREDVRRILAAWAK